MYTMATDTKLTFLHHAFYPLSLCL